MLPDRIELSTSPLPRGCSTTELRQLCSDAAGTPTAASRCRGPSKVGATLPTRLRGGKRFVATAAGADKDAGKAVLRTREQPELAARGRVLGKAFAFRVLAFKKTGAVFVQTRITSPDAMRREDPRMIFRSSAFAGTAGRKPGKPRGIFCKGIGDGVARLDD